jgi:hypothetical protein
MVPALFELIQKVLMTYEDKKSLLDAYTFFRTAILDTTEAELKDSPRWSFIRSRLLRYCGQSGFEGKLLAFLERLPNEER